MSQGTYKDLFEYTNLQKERERYLNEVRKIDERIKILAKKLDLEIKNG